MQPPTAYQTIAADYYCKACDALRHGDLIAASSLQKHAAYFYFMARLAMGVN